MNDSQTAEPHGLARAHAELKPGNIYYQSEWFELDREHLEGFAWATYLDPKHVDLTTGKNNPYGSELVDGFWQLSSLLYFNFKYGFRENEHEYGMNYGLDRVRFTGPLMLGERIRVTSTILDITPRKDGTLIKTHNVMEVEGKDRPCMVADLLLLRYSGAN